MSQSLKQSEYYEFVRWLAIPSVVKQQLNVPLDQKELADQLGVHETTLSRWKQDPNFHEDLRREINKWAIEQTPDVIASLLFRIKQKGDPLAVKLWLQHFEGFEEKTKVEHEGEIKQTVQVEVKEEKKIAIMTAFANFGMITEIKNDQKTTANSNTGTSRRVNRKQRVKNSSSKGK